MLLIWTNCPLNDPSKAPRPKLTHTLPRWEEPELHHLNLVVHLLEGRRQLLWSTDGREMTQLQEETWL